VTTSTGRGPALPSGPAPLTSPTAGRSPARPWNLAWEWVTRPTHYRGVRALRFAIATGNSGLLEPLLDPAIAVVIEGGDHDQLDRRVVVGRHDASALLMHGLGAHAGLRIDIRSVAGQAGLMLADRGHAAAAIAVDFTGRRITMVWIRLHPYVLRHWNRV
jgi:hypothetical protein